MSMDIAVGARSIGLDQRDLLAVASMESRRATRRMFRRSRRTPMLFLMAENGSIVIVETTRPGQAPDSR